jgi:hypothetical protein
MDQRRFNQPTRHSKKSVRQNYSSKQAYIRGKRKPIWWHMLSTDWNITRH